MTPATTSESLFAHCHDPVRVLIVPGLNDSGPTHWQSVLQQHHGPRAVRVKQRDWGRAELGVWADRIAATLAREPLGRWVAVAHSFGCLAFVDALMRGLPGIEAVVLVAPADPLKFGVADLLPRRSLPLPSRLVASRTDPWMSFASVCQWSGDWGSKFIDLGDAGHVNAESGHGPWPLGQQIVEREIQRLHRLRRLARLPAETQPAQSGTR